MAHLNSGDYFFMANVPGKGAAMKKSYGSKRMGKVCLEDESSVDANGIGTQQNACCECPVGGRCYQGSEIKTILVEQGYWRSGHATAEVWSCEHDFACNHKMPFSGRGKVPGDRGSLVKF